MSNGQRHIFQRFDQELDRLHGRILDMGRLVERQISAGLEVLRDADVEGARALIARDSQINALDVEIDELLVRLIARRQPLARDLRELMTVNKIANDIERCGDEIRKLGRLTVQLHAPGEPPPPPQLFEDIFLLTGRAGDMLHRVLEAFDRLDLDLAVDVIGRQAQLQQGYAAALRRLAACVMQEPRSAAAAIEVTLVLRALERIGGHAKNIAGHLVFLATGKDVRHRELDEVEAVVGGAR
ncbi:MAG TPA: phosphate signaling complex protein PhoU [Gammaproteobacteria bacterium]